MRSVFVGLIMILMVSGNGHAALVTSGELIRNPFFTGSDYSNWTINSPWRSDGGNDRLVFDVNNTNSIGFPGAITSGKDLTSETNVTALDNYDPATTRLTALSFNDVFLNTFAGPASDGTYKFFVEFDLNTTGGLFRAKSQELENPWSISGTQSLNMSWNTDPFTSNGVALNDITSTEYKLIMFVELATTDESTTFFTVDNLSVTYTVNSVPEPSSFIMLGVASGLLVNRRRRSAG